MRWNGREKEGKVVGGNVRGERRKDRGQRGGDNGKGGGSGKKGKNGGNSWLGLKPYRWKEEERKEKRWEEEKEGKVEGE